MDGPDNGSRGGGLAVIISGPSGVGKTTIAQRLLKELNAVFSVSVTTRPRSDQERDGVDYRFIDEKTFQTMREAGELLEWAEVFGHYYGTPRWPVEEAIRRGQIILLAIDIQGAIQVKQKMPEAFGIFILPPSMDVLAERLKKRGRDDAETIQRRLAKAQTEIATARSCGAYDAFVINDDLERAVEEALSLIRRRLKKAEQAD